MIEGVLFVSNGHGEAAIARRIAGTIRGQVPLRTDHLALVGAGMGSEGFADVGPQRRMPSGGLVAMGNLRNLARDVLHGGLIALVLAQAAFLRRAARQYRCVVAVGDVYALALTYLARRPTIFVGTAKSVYVAPYGPFERVLLRRARRVFVRDAATAAALGAAGVEATPANVIADLAVEAPERFPWERRYRLVLLPGSREEAYADAAALASVVRGLGALRPDLEAALSVAPGLSAQRMASTLAGEGWEIAPGPREGIPFVAESGGVRVRAWAHPFGGLFPGATVAFGQAGTANEAAASAGVPVVALERRPLRGDEWYRMRQARLLGDALAVVTAGDAPAFLAALLDDAGRRAKMSRAGRERMGGPGGAARIAEAIAACR